MADYLILQVQFDVHMIANPRLPGDARQHPKLLAPLNSSDWNDRLTALRDSWFSLLIFQVLLYCRLFTALFSFYSALASVWKLGVYHVFTCMVALNSNFVPTSSSTSDSSALTPAWCSPEEKPLSHFSVCRTFLDLLKMKFTKRYKLSLPVHARLLGKVKIIVSLPAVNIVVATADNLLGSLTFKTLGNWLPPMY